MPRMKPQILAVAALVTLGSLSSSGAPPATGVSVTAIVGATVIHPERDGAAAAAQETVVVAGDRIATVGPAASTPIPQGARVIENARVLIPAVRHQETPRFRA